MIVPKYDLINLGKCVGYDSQALGCDKVGTDIISLYDQSNGASCKEADVSRPEFSMCASCVMYFSPGGGRAKR